MPNLTYTEAAHRLRMTVGLLKWCERYAPRGDGRKLVFAAGLIDEADLFAFDLHLRSAWASRAVPTGIRNELHLEAAGMCGVCCEPCEHFEEAHVDRKDKELSHYCQHPHNLILLCGSCHGRYDRGSTITQPVVRKRKDILLSRLMEDVDRDMAVARIAREGLAEIHRTFAASAGKPDQHSIKKWVSFTENLFAQGNTPANLVAPPEGAELGTKLEQASKILVGIMPVTSGTLRAAAEKIEEDGPFTAPTEAEAWEFIESDPVAGECLRCSQQTPIESYTCLKCEHCGTEHYGEVPIPVETSQLSMSFALEDAQGESYDITCETCGSEELEFEFQSLCDYCRHVMEKDD